MSVLFSVIPIDQEFINQAKGYLLEEGVILDKLTGSARWCTLGEFKTALKRVNDAYSFELGGGMITIRGQNEFDYQHIYLFKPDPESDSAPIRFYLLGYNEQIMEPLLKELSICCGDFIVVDNEAKVVFQTAHSE